MGEAYSFVLPWWSTSVLFCLFVSLYMLINQQLKARPSVMMVWRGSILAVFASPLMFFVDAPTNPKVYLISISMGFLMAYLDNRMFTSAAKYGAGVTSRIFPISMIISFVLWLLINPNDFEVLKGEPYKMVGILSCLSVALGAIFFMRKDPITKEAILFLLPTVFVISFVDVMNKSLMVLIEYKAIIYHICLASFVAGLLNFVVYLKENRSLDMEKENKGIPMETLFSKNSVKAGGLAVLLVFIVMLFKGYSMQHTPNPAYVSAIGYTSPLLILAFNKIKGIKDEASVKAGLVLVASIICMVILVS
jgi:hypothetical protein